MVVQNVTHFDMLFVKIKDDWWTKYMESFWNFLISTSVLKQNSFLAAGLEILHLRNSLFKIFIKILLLFCNHEIFNQK